MRRVWVWSRFHPAWHRGCSMRKRRRRVRRVPKVGAMLTRQTVSGTMAMGIEKETASGEQLRQWWEVERRGQPPSRQARRCSTAQRRTGARGNDPPPLLDHASLLPPTHLDQHPPQQPASPLAQSLPPLSLLRRARRHAASPRPQPLDPQEKQRLLSRDRQCLRLRHLCRREDSRLPKEEQRMRWEDQ